MQRTATQTTPIQAGPGPSDVRPYRERLLRIDDVCFMTGLGRSTIYAKVKAGDFPSAVQLHGTSVAWRETEVDAWIAARPAVGATPPAPPAKPGRSPRAPRPTRAVAMGAI
ncbi:helix-turn-helix transcriptional regulator [Acidovorax sp. Q11]